MSCGGVYTTDGTYYYGVAEINVYDNDKLVAEIDILEGFQNTNQYNPEMIKQMAQSISSKLKKISETQAGEYKEDLKNTLVSAMQQFIIVIDRITPKQAQIALQKLGSIVDQVSAMANNYMVIQKESMEIANLLNQIQRDLESQGPNNKFPIPTHAMGNLPSGQPSQHTGPNNKFPMTTHAMGNLPSGHPAQHTGPNNKLPMPTHAMGYLPSGHPAQHPGSQGAPVIPMGQQGAPMGAPVIPMGQPVRSSCARK